MSLFKTRIQKLKHNDANDGVAASSASIKERVQQLRGNETRRALDGEQRDATLAGIVGAEILIPGVLLYSERIPIAYCHGNHALSEILSVDLRDHEIEGSIAVENLIFFDTETTGLSGGSGTIAFMLGLARIEGDAVILRQYFITRFSAEQYALQHAAQWFNDSSVLVSYNGKCFDAPLLRTRYRLNQLACPLTALAHVDLLFSVRNAYAKKWENCRLTTVERNLFAIKRADDIPGDEIPEAWFQFIKRGSLELMPKIFSHNRLDLLSLVALLSRLHAVYEDPVHFAADVGSVAKYLIRTDHDERAFNILKAGRASLSDDALGELALLYKKRGEWEAAREIWKILAQNKCVNAMQQLAKYYEHVEKNYDSALLVTEQLLQVERVSNEHLKRKSRLESKMQKYALSA